MKNRAPDTPTSVLGVGYGIVEAGVDQFRQIGEDLNTTRDRDWETI